ncbi:MAG: TMEM175 family protein [Methanomicrobiales archaeon]
MTPTPVADQSEPPVPRKPAGHDSVCKNLDRLIALSDGVFAFAVTLLALSLIVPTLSTGAHQNELATDLMGMLPTFLSYFVSFFVIASWWRGHHRVFTYIKRCNSTLISLNFYFLLCITIIPFLTNLIIQYGNFELATVLFAAMQVLTGVMLIIIWMYASRNHRLTDPHLSARVIKFNYSRELIVIAVFLISIPIAFFSTSLAQISWIALAPLASILQRVYRDVEEFVEVEEEGREKKE